MNKWLNGGLDGSMNEWTEKWMEGWKDGWATRSELELVIEVAWKQFTYMARIMVTLIDWRQCDEIKR